MREIDKSAMGQRIRQIRLGQGLRQWELARLLGTTQSAVHKYEHGVIPEPRRLIELARIGGTSIEWVLTGQHWENGSADQARLDPEVLGLACALQEFDAADRACVDEALRICRQAIEAVRSLPAAHSDPTTAAMALRDQAPHTVELLTTAWQIQRAVARQVTEEANRRLSSAQPAGPSGGSGSSSETKTS